ncbi:MAG TPA: MFS transporter [Stackebrandtia sp.]|jgi:MFS family permease|uniref:MFS transporter n=1 Tax=Stackebrandtia sp. TaxID=2023065 RepID=UPI002D577D5D|nr:MFS transporter [Stackebrandtia sp.]HZE39185.1 MFS transporter [Stackebrandtia sp.]
MSAPKPTRRGLIAVLSAMAAGWTSARLLGLALPWFVLTSTGSTAATGAVVLAQMGPYVVAQLLSGPIIDRIGPRRVSVVGDIIAAVGLAVIPVLHLAGVLSLPVLFVAIAIVGVSDGPANVAKAIFIPSVTKAAGMRLERGTGLSGAIERAATTVGPAVAGVLIAAVGGVYALWITAALTAVASATVALFVTNPEVEPEPDRPTGYLGQLRQGGEFLRKDGLLSSIIGMVFVTNLLDQAWTAVLLPVWAKHFDHGPQAIGLMISIFGATSVIASLAAAAWGHRLPRRLVYIVGFMLGGVPRFIVMAMGAPLWVVALVFGVGGLASGFLNPIIGAVQYERVPAAMLGRVSTLTRALAWAGIPFGGMVGSAAVAAAGISPALLIIGAAYLVVTLVPGLRKEWAQMNHGAAVPKQATEEPEPAPAT